MMVTIPSLLNATSLSSIEFDASRENSDASGDKSDGIAVSLARHGCLSHALNSFAFLMPRQGTNTTVLDG
jgi:hypothetical protein